MATEAVSFHLAGLSEFHAALSGVVKRADLAARTAVLEGAHRIEAEAKKNASGPARWRKGVNYPRDGGPGVVTGTGRRSYHTEGPQRTAVGWSAKTGPSALHMLFVELGTARGIPGYPALRPAVESVKPELEAVFARAWREAIA